MGLLNVAALRAGNGGFQSAAFATPGAPIAHGGRMPGEENAAALNAMLAKSGAPSLQPFMRQMQTDPLAGFRLAQMLQQNQRGHPLGGNLHTSGKLGAI